MASPPTIPPRHLLAIPLAIALLATASAAQGPTIVCEHRYQLARMLQVPGNGQPATVLFRLPAAYWVPLDAVCDPTSRTLYWADGAGSNRILRANLDGSSYLYYVDGNDLCRAATNGTAVQVLFPAQQSWPIGCPLVDATNGHVYVGADNAIWRFDLAGGNARTVVTGLGFPRVLALDVARSQIFWIDAQPATDHIGRGRLDGSAPDFSPAGLAGLSVQHAFFTLSAANVPTFASPAAAVAITP